MGKNSRRNKIWNSRANVKEQPKSSSIVKKKKKPIVDEEMNKIHDEMSKLYKEEFGYDASEISGKEIEVSKQIDNFVKNVKFWEKHAAIEGSPKKVAYCNQAKKHLMDQLPTFPEAIQKTIVGNLV